MTTQTRTATRQSEGPIHLVASSVWADPDDIRTRFCREMSDMYRAEVPLYGDLLELVHEVNEKTLSRNPSLRASLEQRNELGRLNVERHGAIRVGTPEELSTLSKIFAIMGMHPVGYYDLSSAGLPVHATAFRPVTQEALDKNPFRIFTSLLRPELIADPATRQLALDTLAKRNIFTDKCRLLLSKAEKQQGKLSEEDSKVFVKEALETFRWHSRSPISKAEYDQLSKASKLAADVCGFQSCHINHLTPRTLDIDAVQRGMAARGITPKAVIEGPPPSHDILLRQTSFLALSEQVDFLDPLTGNYVSGYHQARFGEIEQRSLALTEEGRQLYSRLLAEAQANRPESLSSSPSHSNMIGINEENEAHLSHYFDKAFPSDYEEIRKQDLGYFRYRLVEGVPLPAGHDEKLTLEDLLKVGCVTYEPLVYEDFLPASAAGIFQSNLGQHTAILNTGPNQAALQQALGRGVIHEMSLYEASQQESLDHVAESLKLGYSLYV